MSTVCGIMNKKQSTLCSNVDRNAMQKRNETFLRRNGQCACRHHERKTDVKPKTIKRDAACGSLHYEHARPTTTTVRTMYIVRASLEMNNLVRFKN